MSKKVAILQSNYIPWKGYFDLMQQVDVFIILDEVQYTKNDWRNRNRIKTPQGLHWLSIPVYRPSSRQKISETRIAFPNWYRKHWHSWQSTYRQAPYFEQYESPLRDLYENCRFELLSEINNYFLEAICSWLHISTPLLHSRDLELKEDRNERLLHLIKQVGGTIYLTGPAAQDYLNLEAFTKENIEVKWMNYQHYPEYPQLYPPFSHQVSIIDLILHTGPEASQYIKRRG
ncbi:MAG: WbqC family protein [Bacteroidota bacterium]